MSTLPESKPYRKILVSAEELAGIVSRLASELDAFYADADRVVALVILEGARVFAADLLAQVQFRVETEALSASSYRGKRQSSGSVRLGGLSRLAGKLPGSRVLILDDIYDTGLTLASVQEWVCSCGPADVKTCVLLEKRIQHTREARVDFLGVAVEDCFVIGYGLDYQGRYRDLPFVAALA